MDYLFTNRGSSEILKTVGENKLLSGWQTVVKEYPDSIITDKFLVVCHLDAKADSDGKEYHWYEVTSHTRMIDRTPAVKQEMERKDQEIKQNTADIQYIAMMSDMEV